MIAHYLYDSDGNRVKKLVQGDADGKIESTLYLEGVFEASRFDGQQNTQLHLSDGVFRVYSERSGTPRPGDCSPASAYILADHLGSSTVVVDAQSGQANREDYAPFAETTFGGFAGKRYRHTGKERDEEDRLYYFGARYLDPHSARWLSPDPLAAATLGSVLPRDAAVGPISEEGLLSIPGLPDGVNGYGHRSESTLDRCSGESSLRSEAKLPEEDALNDYVGNTNEHRAPLPGSERILATAPVARSSRNAGTGPLSEDGLLPIPGLPDGLNAYAVARQNPLTRADSTGLLSQSSEQPRTHRIYDILGPGWGARYQVVVVEPPERHSRYRPDYTQ